MTNAEAGRPGNEAGGLWWITCTVAIYHCVLYVDVCTGDKQCSETGGTRGRMERPPTQGSSVAWLTATVRRAKTCARASQLRDLTNKVLLHSSICQQVKKANRYS